jgi:putative hydrolase of the HAD superfamily
MLTKDYGMDEESALEFGKWVFDDPLWSELDLGNYPLDYIVQKFMEKRPKWKEEMKWFIDNCELMSVFRPEVYDRVHKLRERGFHIYLLSNYNASILWRHSKGASFYADIDGKIVSSEVNVIKPDRAIYEKLFETYNLVPEESFFFDDRKENIEGANACGTDGYIVTTEEDLLTKLDEIITAGPM